MVPLDEKINTEKALGGSPKAYAFYSFLKGKPLNIPESDITETDKIYYSVLTALQKNDIKSFEKYYSELSKRKVLKEQPIIYDNYLLLVLIIGVSKCNLSADWIHSVILLRDTTNNPEKLITASFLNLINKNYLSTEGIPSIVLSSLLKIDDTQINSAIVKNAYEANTTIEQYLDKDLFLSSVYFFSDHYVLSVSIDPTVIELKRFETIFLRRILLLQNILYVLIVIIIICAWLLLIQKYPKVKEFANDVGVVLQLIGIGLFAFLLNRVKFKFGVWLKLFFGYKNMKGNT